MVEINVNQMKVSGICFAALSAMFSFSAAAQNLNPTVEVSRQYRGTMSDLDKPSVEMAVPDSVMKFNLQFDYSVFDSPFKGAYEFRPFLMDMDIAPAWSGEKSFYLRAGAGFSLHPTLDFVWSPVRNDRFRLSVYADHRSYIGNYRSLGTDGLLPEAAIVPDGTHYSGHDLLSRAGVDGTFDWETGVLSFRAGYYGTAFKDTVLTRAYDGLDLNFGITSKQRIESHFVYDVNLGYRFAEDKGQLSWMTERGYLSEHDLNLDVSLGGSFGSGHIVLADFGLDYASYGGDVFGSSAGNVSVTPHYLFRNSRWDVDLGVRLAFLFRENHAPYYPPMNMTGGQVVYPDVKIGFSVIERYMDLYLTAGGGPDINKYSSMLDSGHHISVFYNRCGEGPLLDNTVERVSASFGLKGNIASRLSYDLSAGYRNFGNAPMSSVTMVSAAGDEPGFVPGIVYTPYQMFYTRLDMFWRSQDFKFGGRLMYQASDVSGRNAFAFTPSDFTGYLSAQYNWKRRIFAGVDCGFATSRHAQVRTSAGEAAGIGLEVPGYADLGVSFEYAFTRKFSFWLRGGNLLNSTIQYTPFHAQSGIYFTAGICLNL